MSIDPDTRVTAASYDAFAEAYRAGTENLPDQVCVATDRLATALPRGARVLEIGSGPGRVARLLEGDGESWSTRGHVGAPRWFVDWREQPLSAVPDAAGWSVVELHRWSVPGGDTSLDVLGRRR